MTTVNGVQAGEHVGNYTLARKVGQGGLGEVWLAYHSKLAHKPMVAIKFVLYPRSQEMLRFEREVEILDMLRLNRHIIKAEDYGEHDEKPYLVMEYAPGGDLTAAIKREPSLLTMADYLDAMADGLDFAHRKSVVHRDLKPSNILFGEDGTLLVADFGIAHEEDYELTDSGVTLGTLEYMSPEQFTDAKRVSSAADIYSLGIITFQMLTKRLPFGHRGQGKTPYQMMHDHCTAPIPQIQLFGPNLPSELQAVLEKALAKKPENRYATAGEFAAAFRAAIPQTGSYSPAVPGLTLPLADTPVLNMLSQLPPLPSAASDSLLSVTTPVGNPSPVEDVARLPENQSVLYGSALGATQALTPAPSVVSTVVRYDPYAELGFETRNKPARNISPWLTMGLLGAIIFILSVALVLAVLIALPALNPQATPTANPSNGSGSPSSTAKASGTATTAATSTTAAVPNKVRVPDITKRTAKEADDAIAAAHLQVGEVRFDYSLEIEVGRVISILPKPGTEVEINSKVVVVVSKGRPTPGR